LFKDSEWMFSNALCFELIFVSVFYNLIQDCDPFLASGIRDSCSSGPRSQRHVLVSAVPLTCARFGAQPWHSQSQIFSRVSQYDGLQENNLELTNWFTWFRFVAPFNCANLRDWAEFIFDLQAVSVCCICIHFLPG
jgi:hypothetical protein